MQRTTRSPFQVEIQEEPRPNLTGTTGEPSSGQVKFPAGCLQGHRIDPDVGKRSAPARVGVLHVSPGLSTNAAR